MKVRTIKKSQLKELIDPDNFSLKKGDDYGDGRADTSAKISSPAMTDKIVQNTKAHPNTITNVGGLVGYIGEGELAEKIIPKSDDGKDLVDKAKADIAKVKELLDSIDFTLVDNETKKTLKGKIDG
jgi:hypothetical protein